MLTIRPIEPHDQSAARALVLDGLVEHFGFLDPSLNPDLDDIAAAYADGCFLVASDDAGMAAAGAYRVRDASTIEIVRMSVRRDLRRAGLGTHMLNALLAHATDAGYRRVVLETTSTWSDVIAFYLRNGFRITHEMPDRFGGETHFEMLLTDAC
jgi:putative acetyltransferase